MKFLRAIFILVMMLLGPVLRLFLGSVRNWFGWSVQALIVCAFLAWVRLDQGTLALQWVIFGAFWLLVSAASIWIKRRWPDLFDRLW